PEEDPADGVDVDRAGARGMHREREDEPGAGDREADGGSENRDQTQPARSEKPPSTTIVCPRIMSASAEQRNATAPAMSSGETRRPTGFAAPARSISSRFGKCSSAPVSTTPPETAFTRIPGASSTPRYRTSASSAALDVP